jgi:hypothetical protein
MGSHTPAPLHVVAAPSQGGLSPQAIAHSVVLAAGTQRSPSPHSPALHSASEQNPSSPAAGAKQNPESHDALFEQDAPSGSSVFSSGPRGVVRSAEGSVCVLLLAPHPTRRMLPASSMIGVLSGKIICIEISPPGHWAPGD